MSDYFDQYDKLTREQRSRLFMLENDNSFDDPEQIECPYCGNTQGIEHSDVGYEQDDETTIKCTHYDCEREFTITAQVSYSWSTQIPDDEAMKLLQAEIAEGKV